jgi:hypothetical protein
MTRRARLLRALVATVAGAGLLAGGAGPVGASHESGETLHCGAEHFVMRPNSGQWGIRKVEGTNTRFIVVSYEVTAQVLVEGGPTYEFEYQKGNGNAHQNQETEHCSFTETAHGVDDPFTAEVEEVDVLFTIALTVVRKP